MPVSRAWLATFATRIARRRRGSLPSARLGSHKATFGHHQQTKRLLNETKAREGRDSEHPDFLHGLGLYRQPLPCSLVWGPTGDTPATRQPPSAAATAPTRSCS